MNCYKSKRPVSEKPAVSFRVVAGLSDGYIMVGTKLLISKIAQNLSVPWRSPRLWTQDTLVKQAIIPANVIKITVMITRP